MTVCLLVTPLVSLIMLFIASKRVRFNFEVRESCIRGGALQITMQAGLSPRFLAGFVKVETEIENTTFHKTERKSFTFKDLSYTPHEYGYDSPDSGRICIKCRKIALIDLFGICSVKVNCSQFAESLVSPVLYDDIQARLGVRKNTSVSGEISLPQKGNDHTEIFNIRDYIAGDSLNSVHWKLSSKFDALKAKEYGSTDNNKTLILVDMSRRKFENIATDEQLNTVLDVTVSLSDALKTSGRIHSVGWFEEGVFTCSEVLDSNTFVQTVYKLMSIKVNDGNAEELFYLTRSAEGSAFTKVIFVTTSVHTEELKGHGGFDITAISVGNGTGEFDEGNIKIINVSCEQVRAALTSSEL